MGSQDSLMHVGSEGWPMWSDPSEQGTVAQIAENVNTCSDAMQDSDLVWWCKFFFRLYEWPVVCYMPKEHMAPGCTVGAFVMHCDALGNSVTSQNFSRTLRAPEIQASTKCSFTQCSNLHWAELTYVVKSFITKVTSHQGTVLKHII